MRCGVLFAILALVVACSPPGPEAQLDNYLARLARTLDVNRPDVEKPSLPRPPRSEALQIPIEGSSLDTLDVLALSGCKVQATIGKRNSSLGRVARPSQRLLLELEYLRLAPDCVRQKQQDGAEELAATLQTAWEQKRRQLPALVFNATLGSAEYRDFWRPASGGETSSAVITALEAIEQDSPRWLSGDYRADNLQFELNLSEVRAGDGGQLLRALGEQAAYLDAANAVLYEDRQRGLLCRGVLRPERVEVLQTVVRKFFVGEVQINAAALGRRQHNLLPPLYSLEDLLRDVLPDDYRTWSDAREDALGRWSKLPREHVSEIQRTLEPCGGLN